MLFLGIHQLRAKAPEDGRNERPGDEGVGERKTTLAVLQRGNRSAAKRRWTVSGLMLQSGWFLIVIGSAPVALDTLGHQIDAADCMGHVVPGARPCALYTFSYLVTSRSYFCLSYPNRFLSYKR